MANHSQRLRREAARWFMRMRDAEPDHPERGRFEAWLMADPAHAGEYSAFSATWEDFDSTVKLKSLAQAMERKKAELAGQRARLGKAVARSLLGVMLVVSSGLLGHKMWREWEAQPLMQMASNTGIGEIGRQTLEDGTALVLNADTSINITYYRDKRTVTLKRGEVIFDVARDPERPFIVESGHARVTVLGTRFAVNRLTDLVRVSVDHGRVRVEAQDDSGSPRFEPIILNDGEVAEVNYGEKPQRIQRNAHDAFAFHGGTLVFDKAALGEIAETLSRYRKLPVRAQASPASSAQITAVVQVRDIEKFLKVLPHIAPVSVHETASETQLAGRKN